MTKEPVAVAVPPPVPLGRADSVTVPVVGVGHDQQGGLVVVFAQRRLVQVGALGGELVGQRVHALAHAQQAHEAAATAFTTAATRAGRRGFELLVQVATLLQGLDDAVHGAAGGAGLLGLRASRLGHAVFHLHGLGRAHRHGLTAALHVQLDAAIAAGDDGFTFLDLVAHLERAGLTVQTHHKGGTGDGLDSCDLAHGCSLGISLKMPAE